MGRGNFEGEGSGHRKVLTHTVIICAKTAEPMEMRFGLWNCVSRRKYKFNRIRQVAPT